MEWGATQDDWAVNLVNVFSAGSTDLNGAQKAIKKVFKNAVVRRAASTLAEQRWASAQGNTFSIRTQPPFKFEVTFPTGPRSEHKELHAALPNELLSAVIREVYSCGGEQRENLRPYYVAESQPMVFWNIVRLYNGDYFKGLRELVPEVDWTFAADRRRTLSAKARVNLEQEEWRQEAKKARSEQLRQAAATGTPPPHNTVAQQQLDDVFSSGDDDDEEQEGQDDKA